MLIRPYEEADEAQVLRLWTECELTRLWNDPRKDIARKLSVQREWFLVGIEEGQVMASAMAGYDGHRGWINYLAVAPAHRRQGHARALVHRIESLLTGAGCPKINLQIRASNEQAVAFYRCIGYAPDEAICFGKRLIPDAPAA